jgi:hypothetical protein
MYLANETGSGGSFFRSLQLELWHRQKQTKTAEPRIFNWSTRPPVGRRRLPPLHSITSSARTRRAMGNSIPRRRAIFKLTTSSKVVGCSIGSADGLVPLSTRCT